MSSITTAIRDASPKHTELLRLLAQADQARSDLSQQQRAVAELESRLARCEKKLEDLDRKRLVGLGKHKNYRDSHFRKFLLKASGKGDWFSDMASKEESDYVDILQQAQQQQQHTSTTRAQLAEAQYTMKGLEATVQGRLALQRQLDELHDEIFSGPTPEFPEEDEREMESNDTLAAYFTEKTNLEAHAKAVELLEQASQSTVSAIQHMDAARAAKRATGPDSTISVILERRSLNQAAEFIRQTQRSVSQLMRLGPDVAVLSISTDRGYVHPGVVLDDIMRRPDGKEELARCATAFGDGLGQTRIRKAQVEEALRRREMEMEEARLRLQKVREGIFERVMKDEIASPVYKA
ncbi:hypothetical protein ACJ41O_010849 [Fusarium nematophilum]